MTIHISSELATPAWPRGAPTASFLYASRPVGSPDLVILDILRAADRGNRANGLSGMLFYSPARYVQLLDGPAETLDRLWTNLREDRRHQILWSGQPASPRRLIPETLSMGYSCPRQLVDAGLDPRGLVSGARPDPAGLLDLGRLLAGLARTLYPAHF